MPKILLTADIHLGYAGKLKDCMWAMDIMAQYARKHNINIIAILGDLFHDRVSLGIEVISSVFKYFRRHKDIKFITYCGNHDMFLKNSWEINSLDPLTDLITVVEGIQKIEIEKQTFWILPFIHYESTYMEELAKIEKQAKKEDVLLTHIGIHGASLNECFLLKHWSTVGFEKSKFDRIFTGHFHCHQKVGENVWYTGSPIPFRFDEGVVDHGFIVYDLETRDVEFIKIFDVCKEFSDYRAPDYLTLIDEDMKEWIDHITGDNVRVSLSRDYTSNEMSDLRTKLKEKGALSASFIQPKKTMDEATAIQNQITGLSTMESTFETWLKHDEPKNFSIPLLKQLCNTILAEAEERIVTEEPADDAA